MRWLISSVCGRRKVRLVIEALFLPSFFFIVEISFYTVDEDSFLLDDILYSKGFFFLPFHLEEFSSI